MKWLHTADWHLGKRLYDRLRLEEQWQIIDSLCKIAEEEEVDAILIAGDLYDSFNPPNEASELFFKALHRLSKNGTRAVVAIAGNHDSADRIEAPDPLAQACGIILMGYPQTEVKPFMLDTGLGVTKSDKGFIEIKLPQYDYPLRVIATPYANEARLRQFLGTENTEDSLQTALEQQWSGLANKYCNEKGVNVLMAHLFMAGNAEQALKEPEDERGILHVGGAQVIYTHSIPNKVQYTALGHLHRYHNLGSTEKPIVYSGSLLEYSFSEAMQTKYVAIVEAVPNEPVQLKKVALPITKQLHRKRFESADEAVAWLGEHQEAYVELTMVSDTYLDGATKKRLQQAHSGIMAIIPEVRKVNNSKDEGSASIDLSQDVSTLFEQYFQHEKGQSPPEDLISLLKEVIGS